jgi:SAM-dependent methyltransferase
MGARFKALRAAAARPYGAAGYAAWQFARGKLRFDPVFAAILSGGLLPDRGTLVDLGCGQGVLLSLLTAAADAYRAGQWPSDWPAPPLNLELRGVERRADRVRAAQRALGERACIEQRDLRDAVLPSCSAVIILDVLLYFAPTEQLRVLERVVRALEPGGVLLLREADAGAGLRFEVTRWSERLLEAARGRFRDGLCYRQAGEWSALLETLGFAVSSAPMSAGTPFANWLFVARRGDARVRASAQ